MGFWWIVDVDDGEVFCVDQIVAQSDWQDVRIKVRGEVRKYLVVG